MNGAATTSRLAMPAWIDETTTTTAPRPTQSGRGHPTVEPVRDEKAQFVGVRLADDPRFIAWFLPSERMPSVQITSRYYIVVQLDEGDVGLVGDAVEVVSPHAAVATKRFRVSVAQHLERQTARTALGRRLQELRARILERGERLLSWDDVEREVEARRGERNP